MFFLTDPSRFLKVLSESLRSPGCKLFSLLSTLALNLASNSSFKSSAARWKPHSFSEGVHYIFLNSPFLPPSSRTPPRLVLHPFYPLLFLWPWCTGQSSKSVRFNWKILIMANCTRWCNGASLSINASLSVVQVFYILIKAHKLT